jgi:predicted DNA-binding protein
MGKQKKDEDVPMKRLTIDIPEETHRKLKILAVESGRTMAEMITEWITQHLPKPKR